MRRLRLSTSNSDIVAVLEVEPAGGSIHIGRRIWRGRFDGYPESRWEESESTRYYLGAAWQILVCYSDNTFGIARQSDLDEMLANHGLRRVA